MYSAKTILNLINNYKLDEAKAKLEANYREELTLASGKAKRGYNPLKIIEKMFKLGQLDKRLNGVAHKQPNGEYHFINGYMTFTASESYGFREAEPHELLKTDKMFPRDYDLENSYTVNRKELELFIKTKAHKGNGKYDNKPYIMETKNGIIGINPEFLQTALDYCQSDTIRFGKIEEGKGLKSPIVIYDELENENVKALVLPVNPQPIEKTIEYMKSWREEYKEVLSNI